MDSSNRNGYLYNPDVFISEINSLGQSKIENRKDLFSYKEKRQSQTACDWCEKIVDKFP
jgi:hypothetical protein